MAFAVMHPWWMLVLHLTMLSCQGERCQTLSHVDVPVDFFATYEDCAQKQRGHHVQQSAVQELETMWLGRLRQLRAWTCEREPSPGKDT